MWPLPHKQISLNFTGRMMAGHWHCSLLGGFNLRLLPLCSTASADQDASLCPRHFWLTHRSAVFSVSVQPSVLAVPGPVRLQPPPWLTAQFPPKLLAVGPPSLPVGGSSAKSSLEFQAWHIRPTACPDGSLSEAGCQVAAAPHSLHPRRILQNFQNCICYILKTRVSNDKGRKVLEIWVSVINRGN